MHYRNNLKSNLFVLVILSTALSCKESTTTNQEADLIIDGKNSAQFYASSKTQLKENGKFFFGVYKKNFTTKLADLPLQGEVDPAQQPSSGYWYPERQGGTNIIVSGNATPLQKFDRAFNGGQDKAVQWEKDKHSKNGSWFGHCNGFASAAQRHPQEPFKNVVHNGVTFTPKDIKALLAEIYMSQDFIFLGGGRCETNNLGNPNIRSDPTEMGICEDINPGTMHAALANWIGNQKHTLIMDYFGGEEVWNYPFYKYSVTRNEAVNKATALSLIGSRSSEYIFNPEAANFARIALQVTYADSTNVESLKTLLPQNLYLEYILELDSAGKIIGGEWIGQSQKSHPDFIWIALPPLEPNGTEFMGNPFVNSDEVVKLWAKSTGNDPENPPLDIVRPEITETWGRFPEFDLTLDSNRRGAVFAGKPTVMKIERRGEYAESGVELEVFLDGNELTKLEGDKILKHQFEPGLGLHRLGLVWNKSGQEIGNETVMFHVVR